MNGAVYYEIFLIIFALIIGYIALKDTHAKKPTKHWVIALNVTYSRLFFF